MDIATAMHIPLENFRWYAAFHDEGNHPHVHMMTWSKMQRQGRLDWDGIYAMRSKLTNAVFRHEMFFLYEQKTVARDDLVREARKALRELVREIEAGICDHPEVEKLMGRLAERLGTVSGKKQYGYLPKSAKAIVNEIIDQMTRVPAIAQCYDHWCKLQGEVASYYSDKKAEIVPLSQRKEFKAIKNAVIREAEIIRFGEVTFEDYDIWQKDAPDFTMRFSDYYRRMKATIDDEMKDIDDRDYAVEEMLKLAEANNRYALYEIGRLYRNGDLLIPDAEKALYWFHRAAERNLAAAQYELGKLLLSVDEVRGTQVGLAWLGRAFSNGSDFAGYRLGKKYLQGNNISKDAAKAVEYFTRAAEAGNQYAQYMLGKLYLAGQDVPRDRERAQYWFTQSAAQGNNYATFFLDRLDRAAPSLLLSATRLMHHIGRIFRENSLPQKSPVGMLADSKLRQKIRAMKEAQGIYDYCESDDYGTQHQIQGY
jgi:TPR repeat protein